MSGIPTCNYDTCKDDWTSSNSISNVRELSGHCKSFARMRRDEWNRSAMKQRGDEIKLFDETGLIRSFYFYSNYERHFIII